VLDLVRMDLATIRRRWSVVLERTVRELQGMPLDDQPQPRKQIACTRSFGRTILDLPPLLEAVSSFASRAAEKLRAQGSYAGAVLVFVHTSPFRPGPHYSRSITIPLRRPTADTAHLVRAAVAGMQRIYSPGYELTKAVVMLLDLAPSTLLQDELDLDEGQGGRDRSRLMSALDALNARYGKGTVQMASAGVASAPKEWTMRQERRTPHYTTSWADMPVARA